MLLCGLAMSIKQVAVAEGVAFGLACLWLFWRRGTGVARLALYAAAMVAVALLPMLVPFLVYGARGEAAREAFAYANFISIFDKDNFGIKAKLAGAAFLFLYCIPLIVLAGVGIRQCWARRRADAPALFLVWWTGAAVLGYLAVPLFFDHYSLPLLVPLCVAASIAFARPSGSLWAGGLLMFCLIQGSIVNLAANRRAEARFAQLSAHIDEARHGGCLYLADGPTWLYHSTAACQLTHYLFPDHLNLYVERKAVGVDPRTELAAILRRRPAVIVTQDSEQGKHNPATQAILWSRIRRDYRMTCRIPDDGTLLGSLRVWQRRDLPPPGGSGPR
jgi:hypothetical protein